MKLLTAQVGWAATSQRIFWTTTAGHEWKDITPKAKAQRVIASVCFIDASNGWALLAYGGKENRESGVSETLFELAFTDNAGESWSTKPLEVQDPDPGRGLSGEAWIDFVDAQHGWLMIRMNGNTAVSPGVLQATEDGGGTWKPLGVPAAGPIRFVTPTDGWLEAGENGGLAPGIYVTRDGGKNWIPLTLKAPPEVGTKIYPTYHLPNFADRDSGYLLVTFSEPNDESPKLALFKTKDRGRTWSLGSTAEEDGTSWHTTFAGSDWLAVGCPSGKSALLREARGNLSRSEPVGIKPESLCSRNGGGIGGVSFADRDRGWVLLLGGELLSTSDGGTIWEKITPPGAVRVAAAIATPITSLVKTEAFGGLPSQPMSATPSGNVSAHIGFDRFPVITKVSEMLNWWNSSPYYDVGIYLPGSKNKSKDPNLTAAWLSAIQSQGWGIIPIWFGLQSACSCHVVQGHCVPFTSQFSTNSTQAKTDGINEAKAAISSAQTLGLSPSIIYHDIENYTPSPSCSPPVQAFLSGWDQQMQTVGKAGVYGNPAPAAQDFSNASPIPDDVWIARYPPTGQPPQMTIWALGTLGDTLWPDSQRIHQPQQNLMQAWGSTTNYQIDPDIEYAEIIVGNGNKSHTFNYTSIDFQGATKTEAYGIANTSQSGEIGKIVGDYQLSTFGNSHGFVRSASGSFTTLDYPGATKTSAHGINDLGQIVGWYVDQSANTHGFLDSSTGFSSIDYPGAQKTIAEGINDAGQISGLYFDSAGVHGFLYYGGNYYKVGYPGGENVTYAYGINGVGHIAGLSAVNSVLYAFIHTIKPPSWDADYYIVDYLSAYPSAFDLSFSGITNNDQVAGWVHDNSGFQSFLYHKNTFDPVIYPGPTYTFAYAANDASQVVGYYSDSANNTHGFLAVPQ